MERDLFEGAQARWPRAASIGGWGRIREQTEDFTVFERLAFVPSGEGEHVFLKIEKRGLNTTYVQRSLAKLFDVRLVDVSYAGLKDRRTVTRQWYSVWLPGKIEIGDSYGNFSGFSVLNSTRHIHKLRRGELDGNCFEFAVREFVGCLDAVISVLRVGQLPNYFGPQRFGYDGSNIKRAVRWINAGRPRISRTDRSIYLSTLRSLLFNDVVAARIHVQSWSSVRPGNYCVEGIPTGPMWGRGSFPTMGAVRDLDMEATAKKDDVRNAL
ncbi:MAG: tRNA pseudouridine(13) synthase TruD [Pseudomonadales bacterium]